MSPDGSRSPASGSPAAAPRGPRASALSPAAPARQEEADLIVVGAGPGGSATAIAAAQRGLDVVLLEKSEFPREKVCGDGLTPRAARMLVRLGVDTDQPGWKRNKGLRIYGSPSGPFEMDWPQLADFPDHGWTCRRSELDDLLAGRAVQCGARLYTGQRVTDPLIGTDGGIKGVRTAEGHTFTAPLVVAADGNSSRVATAMGRHRLPGRPLGVAVRTYYRSPRSADDYLESWLELRDGQDLLPGYGWIFPMADGTCNVGLGMLNTSTSFGRVDYRALLRRWVAGTPAQWELNPATITGPVQSGALPMAFNRQPAYQQGLLLVGDAAGMVSPFNGEGISYAMESGELAAAAAAEAIARGIGTPSAEKALHGYVSELQSSFGGYYRLGTVFVRLIGDPRVMKLCTSYGLPRRRLMRLVHKLLANLTDARQGDLDDLVINTLSRLAPTA